MAHPESRVALDGSRFVDGCFGADFKGRCPRLVTLVRHHGERAVIMGGPC